MYAPDIKTEQLKWLIPTSMHLGLADKPHAPHVSRNRVKICCKLINIVAIIIYI